MESKAKALGHPIHTMLIPFPLGLLGTAVIFDVIGARKGGSRELSQASHLMIGAGVATGLIAATFGLVDGLAIPPGTRAKQVAIRHGAGNAVLLALFAAAWRARRDDPATVPPAILRLEVAGLGLASVTGWLGGELMNRLGVGVHPGANVDEPSSL